MIYQAPEERILGSAESMIPEIKLTFVRETARKPPFHLGNSDDCAAFVRSVFAPGEIELQEQFVVLYVDNALNLIGYYKLSRGGITEVTVDVRLILGAALKCAATGIFLSHNHPSGQLNPSNADLYITSKILLAGELLYIRLLDHLIVTKDSYFSFADNMVLDNLKNPEYIKSTRVFDRAQAAEVGSKEKSMEKKKQIEGIYKKRVMPDAHWEEITIEKAIKDLEGHGYWQEGTTREMLEEGLELWTAWAFYKVKFKGEELHGVRDEQEKAELELRLEIKRHLDKCDHEATPKVCGKIQTIDGYRQIEDMIIRIMLSDHITPGPAIAQIESDLP